MKRKKTSGSLEMLAVSLRFHVQTSSDTSCFLSHCPRSCDPPLYGKELHTWKSCDQDFSCELVVLQRIRTAQARTYRSLLDKSCVLTTLIFYNVRRAYIVFCSCSASTDVPALGNINRSYNRRMLSGSMYTPDADADVVRRCCWSPWAW